MRCRANAISICGARAWHSCPKSSAGAEVPPRNDGNPGSAADSPNWFASRGVVQDAQDNKPMLIVTNIAPFLTVLVDGSSRVSAMIRRSRPETLRATHPWPDTGAGASFRTRHAAIVRNIKDLRRRVIASRHDVGFEKRQYRARHADIGNCPGCNRLADIFSHLMANYAATLAGPLAEQRQQPQRRPGRKFHFLMLKVRETRCPSAYLTNHFIDPWHSCAFRAYEQGS